MKHLLAFLFSICLMASSVPALAETPAASINTAEASTVIVYGDYIEHDGPSLFDPVGDTVTQTDTPYCSGVLIGKTQDYDIVATARHCVIKTNEDGGSFDPTPTSVKFSDGTHYAVIGSADSPDDDFGVLYVETTGRPMINISTDGVQRGADYFIFSMPNGVPWSFTPATSMQGDKDSDAAAPWQHTDLLTCPGCGPGDSGGGVFDTAGNLVGISVAADGNYTLAVPVRRVLDDLKNLVDI